MRKLEKYFVDVTEKFGNILLCLYEKVLPRREYKNLTGFGIRRVLPIVLIFSLIFLVFCNTYPEIRVDNQTYVYLLSALILAISYVGSVLIISEIQYIRVMFYGDKNDKYSWITHAEFVGESGVVKHDKERNYKEYKDSLDYTIKTLPSKFALLVFLSFGFCRTNFIISVISLSGIFIFMALWMLTLLQAALCNEKANKRFCWLTRVNFKVNQ